jgi:hypothetical protein
MTHFENPDIFTRTSVSLVQATDASKNLFLDTVKNPIGRIRQTEIVLDGLIVGGLKEIPNQVTDHPVETAQKAFAGAALGSLLALARTIENPLVSVALGAASLGLSGAYVWNLGQRLSSNELLENSLDSVWNSGDEKTVSKAKEAVRDVLGIEAFDLGVAALSGGAVAKMISEFTPNPLSNEMRLATANGAKLKNLETEQAKEAFLLSIGKPLMDFENWQPEAQADYISVLIKRRKFGAAKDVAKRAFHLHREQSSRGEVEESVTIAKNFGAVMNLLPRLRCNPNQAKILEQCFQRLDDIRTDHGWPDFK